MEFIETSQSTEKGSILQLAEKLAVLHKTPAPIPEGQTQPVFGFPVTTCCGSTGQKNTYKSSWADFYAENRLRAILHACDESNGPDLELKSWVEKTISNVVYRLLGDDHLGGKEGIVPVIVHGDLWRGNQTRGRIGGQGEAGPVVFDPSASYAHSEYELGIMMMFGGFPGGFFQKYHASVPKTEPVEEYEDRISLYQL
jgi:fructosamine-3-kinase